MKSTDTAFGWEAFYSEFADKLLGYKNKRDDLLKLLEEAHKEAGFRFPFVEKEKTKSIDDICPFTVFGCFN